VEFELDKLRALRLGVHLYLDTLNRLVDELAAEASGETPVYRSSDERTERLSKIASGYLTHVNAMHIQAATEVKDLPMYLADQSAKIVDGVLTDTVGFYMRSKTSAELAGHW
jgi:hypothetical protein